MAIYVGMKKIYYRNDFLKIPLVPKFIIFIP
jgi:hypothetical protein